MLSDFLRNFGLLQPKHFAIQSCYSHVSMHSFEAMHLSQSSVATSALAVQSKVPAS